MQSFVSVRLTTVVVVVVHLYPMSLIVNKKTECSVVREMSIYLRLLLQGEALPVDVADNNNNNNKTEKKEKWKWQFNGGCGLVVYAWTEKRKVYLKNRRPEEKKKFL